MQKSSDNQQGQVSKPSDGKLKKNLQKNIVSPAKINEAKSSNTDLETDDGDSFSGGRLSDSIADDEALKSIESKGENK
jgi:hypothetical protein